MFSTKKLLGIPAFLALLGLPGGVEAAAGAQALAAFVQIRIIEQALIAFWGISAATVFYYAVRMIYSAHNEQAYSDLSNSLIYALTGFAIIACSLAFTSAFTTGNTQILGASIASVGTFIITLSAGVFILMVVVAGIRMATTGGDSGEFEKWRKVLIGACIGGGIMILARIAIVAIADASAGSIAEEIRGVLLFLLTIAGFACALAIIVAGMMLIISIDEGLKDRAKKTIFSTLIGLAFVMAAYTLISIFL